MSHRIALITDSTCDLPDALLQRYDIRMVPLYIHWGDEVLRDRVDIDAPTFFRRLREEAEVPKTSQPAPRDFLAAFEAARAEGAEEAVVITISTAMSGTYQSARQAASMMEDFPVHVVDARFNSFGLGWQVLAAARAREAGGDAQAMIAAADAIRERTVLLVLLDTLDYLRRGGRIGAAKHFIGTMLKLKPLIAVVPETGAVTGVAQIRPRKRARETLYQTFVEQIKGIGEGKLHITMLHTGLPEVAEALAQRIQAELKPVERVTGWASMVLGVHTGPQALEICGYVEPSSA